MSHKSVSALIILLMITVCTPLFAQDAETQDASAPEEPQPPSTVANQKGHKPLAESGESVDLPLAGILGNLPEDLKSAVQKQPAADATAPIPVAAIVEHDVHGGRTDDENPLDSHFLNVNESRRAVYSF